MSSGPDDLNGGRLGDLNTRHNSVWILDKGSLYTQMHFYIMMHFITLVAGTPKGCTYCRYRQARHHSNRLDHLTSVSSWTTFRKTPRYNIYHVHFIIYTRGHNVNKYIQLYNQNARGKIYNEVSS